MSTICSSTVNSWVLEAWKCMWITIVYFLQFDCMTVHLYKRKEIVVKENFVKFQSLSKRLLFAWVARSFCLHFSFFPLRRDQMFHFYPCFALYSDDALTQLSFLKTRGLNYQGFRSESIEDLIHIL